MRGQNEEPSAAASYPEDPYSTCTVLAGLLLFLALLRPIGRVILKHSFSYLALLGLVSSHLRVCGDVPFDLFAQQVVTLDDLASVIDPTAATLVRCRQHGVVAFRGISDFLICLCVS